MSTKVLKDIRKMFDYSSAGEIVSSKTIRPNMKFEIRSFDDVS